MFEGTLTALVTPFDVQGEPDEAAFRRHVARQIDGGIQGLVPCGTTGEAATMSAQEQRRVIRWCVEEAAGSDRQRHTPREALAKTRAAEGGPQEVSQREQDKPRTSRVAP